MLTAHLIHGYLGAGKTTFARQLERDIPAIRFSHDEWMVRLYGDDPPETRCSEYAKRVSGVMEPVWTRCVALKMNVVLDFGFWTRSERDRVRGLVASLGGNSACIVSPVPMSSPGAASKRGTRGSQLTLYIAPNTFNVLKARFEPLEPDETRVEVEA